MSLAILDVQYICKEFSGMYTPSAHNTQRTTINSFDNKGDTHFAQIPQMSKFYLLLHY